MPVQPFESVTLTVIGNVPGTCGVPERTPLVRERQAGRQRAAGDRERGRADARRSA